MIIIVLFILMYFGFGFLPIPRIIPFAIYWACFIFARYLRWKFPTHPRLTQIIIWGINIIGYLVAVLGIYYLFTTFYYCDQTVKVCAFHLLT